MKSAKWLFIAMVLSFAAGSAFIYGYANRALDSAATSKKIELDVLKGMRPREIAYALEKEGVIRFADLF